ncbi:serine-rich adhesin for platelets [Lucilia sericata]|uniref:serine-rich adhesin for platelets n=1 Tax=Lucilia sericata TaxID=13632 RepID=UPI0018A80D94|nr:serine-rich adhesin for platelets [Lucilia sericata]XP_037824953.1 serine-rich adhesin for platelets [Lucilia sericata]
MIPTTATSSSPPIASVGSIGNQLNNSPPIPGSANASNGASAAAGIGQGNISAFLGIASLILEGRALAEDEYAIQTTRNEFKTSLGANTADCGRQSPKPSTSRAAFGENMGSSMGPIATSTFSIDLANYLGRKSSNSPDSTTSSFLRDYYSSSSESASSSVESNHSRWSQKLSQLRQESPSAHHHVLAPRQRIAVECPRGSDAEYVALSINTEHHGTHEDRRGGDFEILRRMSINQMNFYNSPNSMGGGGGGGVVVGGSGSGGSSENFMCSLQSLASNTCLRVGNPLLVNNTSPPRYSNNRQISSSSPRFSTPPQHQQLDISTGSASSSSSSSSAGVGGAISANSWYNSSTPHLANSSSNNSSNNKEYLLRRTSTTTQRMAIPSAQTASNNKTINSSTPNQNLHSNIFSRNSLIIPSVTTTNSNSGTVITTLSPMTSSPATASRNQTYPQQGPHCDQFLRKMGLAKGDALETEEHHCDMSYVNITCTRWRAYCIKMENILARGEPICIEVYLGPVGNKILLEQWIITQKEKQPPPTMTLPSLCSAIRSQLYFSQISAWCDLIKKSDKTIYETGRVIYTTPQQTTTSAAGDLATTTATTNNAITTAPTATSTTSMLQHPTAITPSSNSGNIGNVIGGGGGGVGITAGVGSGKKRPSAPRLNIFYRIKQYDSTACFNSKPNVHNFPNVNITENCSVSVCLKSLPRITGGIPKVGTLTATQQQQNPTTSGLTAATTATPPVNSATPTCLAAKNKTKAATAKATTSANVAAAAATSATTLTTNANNKSTILIMNCDNNLKEHQQQKQLTASTSSSLCSSFSVNGKNCKKSSGQQLDFQDADFEFDDQHIDLSAGGDNSTISCGGSASVGDCDSSNSSFSTNNYGNLSHREKQLLKYRKRMLKRDKKQQLRSKTNEITSATNQKQEDTDNNVNNKMEQGEDDDDDVDGEGEGDDRVDDVNDDDDDGNNSDTADRIENKSSINSLAAKGQRQQQLPNNHINSIPSTNQLQLQQQQQQQHHHQQVKMISTGTQTITNTCTACGFEKSMICLKCNPLIKVNSDEEIMDAETSSASSLSSSDIIHTPRNNAELLLQAIQRTPKSNKKHKHKSKDSNQMAAIKQPTINSNSSNNIRISSSQNSSTMNGNGGNNNSHSGSGVINGSSNNLNNLVVGCQLCKRQKTQHHFNQPSGEDLSSEDNNSSLKSVDKNINSLNEHTDAAGDDAEDGDGGDNETDGGKVFSADCVDNVAIVVDAQHADDYNVRKMSTSEKSCSDHEVMEEEYFETSTKLTPHIDRCSLNSKSYYAQIPRPSANGSTDRIEYQQQRSCSTPPLQEQTENSSCSNNDTTNSSIMMMAQFKTPTPSEQYQNAMKNKMQQQQQQPHKHTPKPNLLHIACNFNKNEEQPQKNSKLNDNNTPTTHNPLLLRRSLPKVNLTPIFCNPNSMLVVSSSPIPIGNGVCNGTGNSMKTKSADINITEASPTFSFESPSSPATPSLTVQKSNSAPTLPNSPSLSPRFIKASAIYKRRSRHLSDRSDRSSLGSDEQFSDEDIDSGMYSPFATSPVKLRTRLAAVFGRKPLLGNLEECLLQRRLVPKIEVMGFKLLLGASGGFCPTQLTIPAAAYFYELKGETLSTPYLCEIRLPRKGYTVPRCGTVQATLLNPMGTVVRMFVIPYDMRDMPTLHQTFIRQRILADSGMESNNDAKSNGVDQQFNTNEENTPMCVNNKQQQPEKPQPMEQPQQQQQRSPQSNNEHHLGHFISAENMKSLRYSIHLRFQTSRSGRLMLHTDIRLLISRRTDCDTAAAHAKGVLEAPNELITNTVMPTNPKYSARQDQTSSKI